MGAPQQHTPTPDELACVRSVGRLMGQIAGRYAGEIPRLVLAWPRLSPEQRRQILDIVEAASRKNPRDN